MSVSLAHKPRKLNDFNEVFWVDHEGLRHWESGGCQ